ncbi:outer membrane beta-barrel protein [Helicobacter bilis]|uniref:outer membrane beta-barrel protein n=1 Tax=Helicobacter bilis TaxID=37372 RepID=UPI000B2A9A76|nr:outer membrane beta-barrel protein [Helicobacter bilis]
MNKHFKKIACVAALSLMPMVAFADDGVGGDSGNGSGLFLGFEKSLDLQEPNLNFYGIFNNCKEFFMNKHFKKIARVAALSLMPMVAFADDGVGGDSGNGSGLFLGLDTGYTFGFEKFQLKNSTTITSITMLYGANIGVKAGYNFYFTQMFGVRGYLDYTFVFNPISASSVTVFSSAHVITLNADLLVNLIQTDSVAFGAFVGIGLGYGMASVTETNNVGTTEDLMKTSGFILPVNVGLSLTANNHHRFELGFKIPTLDMGVTETSSGKIPTNLYETNSVRLFTTSVGYSYIF